MSLCILSLLRGSFSLTQRRTAEDDPLGNLVYFSLLFSFSLSFVSLYLVSAKKGSFSLTQRRTAEDDPLGNLVYFFLFFFFLCFFLSFCIISFSLSFVSLYLVSSTRFLFPDQQRTTEDDPLGNLVYFSLLFSFSLPFLSFCIFSFSLSFVSLYLVSS